MSRVHDALRRAGKYGALAPGAQPRVDVRVTAAPGLLELVKPIAYNPSPSALVIDALHPHAAPTEEFRTLRTRLQSHAEPAAHPHRRYHQPAPAEGKSLSAANLALAEAQLSGNLTLLCDFDFRRPVVHHLMHGSQPRHHRLPAGKGRAA